MSYDILYADPPWQYGQPQYTKSGTVKSVEDHYPTMTLEAMKALKVPNICKKDCLLFMWTSSPHLAQAIELMEAWGFEYKTIAFVWEKQKPNPGSYTISSCEICIVGKKGKIPSPRGSRKERQFLSEMRTIHYRKPAEIRNRIMRMFPTQKKLELFAREATEGWELYGNEVETEISL